MPPSDSCEDDDIIALDMEEAIDDDIMFHGGNPFDWDTRSDYLDDPFGFGGDDGNGGTTGRSITPFVKIFPYLSLVCYNGY